VKEAPVIRNLVLDILGGTAASPQLVEVECSEVAEELRLKDGIDSALSAHWQEVTCRPMQGSDRD
jgi:hypothetical protein